MSRTVHLKSPIPPGNRPSWVVPFNGEIDMKNIDWPPPPFKHQIMEYKYTLGTTHQILKAANNLATPMPDVAKKVKLKKTTPMTYEKFSDFTLVDPRMHLRPIWLLVAFLAMIMIITSLS